MSTSTKNTNGTQQLWEHSFLHWWTWIIHIWYPDCQTRRTGPHNHCICHVQQSCLSCHIGQMWRAEFLISPFTYPFYPSLITWQIRCMIWPPKLHTINLYVHVDILVVHWATTCKAITRGCRYHVRVSTYMVASTMRKCPGQLWIHLLSLYIYIYNINFNFNFFDCTAGGATASESFERFNKELVFFILKLWPKYKTLNKWCWIWNKEPMSHYVYSCVHYSFGCPSMDDYGLDSLSCWT